MQRTLDFLCVISTYGCGTSRSRQIFSTLQIFFGQCPIGVESELDGLPQISTNFLESRSLGVRARKLLDEPDVAFRHLSVYSRE